MLNRGRLFKNLSSRFQECHFQYISRTVINVAYKLARHGWQVRKLSIR